LRVRPNLTRVMHLSCVILYGRLLALAANRRKKLAKDKHSSLLRTIINYGREKFYGIGTRSEFKDTK
jgi:hypothetical protein